MADALDCVTIGETMLRLDADPAASLEDLRELRVFVAGTESNVAVTLARLGLRTAWISKLPDHVLGRRVEREIRGHGVDTSRVRWEPDGRLGVYYTHLAPAPRAKTVLYDRRDSSLTRLDPSEVDWEFVRAARALHLTGITPALGERPAAVARRALREARDAGMQITFDVNYRARLWTPEAARNTLLPLLAMVDLLICSRRDAEMVFGIAGLAEHAARALWEIARCREVCLTLGAEGAGSFNGQRWEHVPAVHSEIVDPIGRGDAFTAGLIYGVLAHNDLSAGMRSGVQLAALKQTFRGDVAWVGPADLGEGAGGIFR